MQNAMAKKCRSKNVNRENFERDVIQRNWNFKNVECMLRSLFYLQIFIFEARNMSIKLSKLDVSTESVGNAQTASAGERPPILFGAPACSPLWRFIEANSGRALRRLARSPDLDLARGQCGLGPPARATARAKLANPSQNL